MFLKRLQTPSQTLEILIDRLAQANSWALKVDTHKETGKLFQVTLQGQASNANIRKDEDEGRVAARKALHFLEPSVNKSYSKGIARLLLPGIAS